MINDPQQLRDEVLLEYHRIEEKMRELGLPYIMMVNLPTVPGEAVKTSFATALLAGGNMAHPSSRHAFRDSMEKLFETVDRGERPS